MSEPAQSSDAAVLDSLERILIVGRRELRTMFRARWALILALVFVMVVVGITVIGDGYERGYVPTIFDLMTPLELIVPLFAIALSYRAILGDATSGELDILRSYPLRPFEQVLGVFLGRSLFVATAVTIALVLSGMAVAVTPPETVRVFATHEVADSPLFFARLVVLTVGFAIVLVSIGLAISAMVTSTRTAFAIIGALLLILFVGFEFAILQGLETGLIPEDLLAPLLGIGPLSAFRGLILETAVAIDPGADAAPASSLISAVALVAWLIVGLTLATVSLRRR